MYFSSPFIEDSVKGQLAVRQDGITEGITQEKQFIVCQAGSSSSQQATATCLVLSLYIPSSLQAYSIITTLNPHSYTLNVATSEKPIYDHVRL